jgi:hypothetical protein
MAQHDYILDDAVGATFRADANSALAAIISNNSGATEPATKYAYQWWADTTTGLLKIRNAANNAWVTVGTLASANLGLATLGVTAGTAVQVDQSVTAWTRSATTTLGTTLNGTLSDTSTTITAFNGVAGVTYHVRALGAGSITYHATDLIITQGLASITTAAGDTFDVEMLTGTTSRVKNYIRAVPPAFKAYLPTTNQAVTSGVSTKVALSAESYDRSGAFDSTTNYRFTPAIAGWYQINGSVYASANVTTITETYCEIKKNGTRDTLGNIYSGPAISQFSSGVSDLIYMNGTTDYLELYATITGTSPVIVWGSVNSFLSGYLVSE